VSFIDAATKVKPSRSFGKNLKALGSVLMGHGNSDDGSEGAIYNNFIGTYLHNVQLKRFRKFVNGRYDDGHVGVKS
jgi:hypothetical protein